MESLKERLLQTLDDYTGGATFNFIVEGLFPDVDRLVLANLLGDLVESGALIRKGATFGLAKFAETIQESPTTAEIAECLTTSRRSTEDLLTTPQRTPTEHRQEVGEGPSGKMNIRAIMDILTEYLATQAHKFGPQGEVLSSDLKKLVPGATDPNFYAALRRLVDQGILRMVKKGIYQRTRVVETVTRPSNTPKDIEGVSGHRDPLENFDPSTVLDHLGQMQESFKNLQKAADQLHGTLTRLINKYKDTQR